MLEYLVLAVGVVFISYAVYLTFKQLFKSKIVLGKNVKLEDQISIKITNASGYSGAPKK